MKKKLAMTRAKDVIYVIGNKKSWQEAGSFKELTNRVPVHNLVAGNFDKKAAIDL